MKVFSNLCYTSAMRLIISVLFFLVLSQPTLAAGSFEFIQCKATGLVDGITEIYFQPTDLEGQACGYLMNEKKNFTCFNGEIYDENLEILSLPHHFGSEELILSTIGRTRLTLSANTFDVISTTKNTVFRVMTN